MASGLEMNTVKIFASRIGLTLASNDRSLSQICLFPATIQTA
jgi:hypothetical protein